MNHAAVVGICAGLGGLLVSVVAVRLLWGRGSAHSVTALQVLCGRWFGLYEEERGRRRALESENTALRSRLGMPAAVRPVEPPDPTPRSE